MSKWKEQWDRVNRWYEQFERINNGLIHGENSDVYKDRIYAFFINCYHLKDWIENDESLNINRPIIDSFIDKNKCLAICGDICNGSKHLSDCNRSHINPQMKSVHHRITIGGGEQIYGANYDILTSDGVKDAFEVAKECMKKWKEFIIREIDQEFAEKKK